MKRISFHEAMSRASFTEHGRALMAVVQRQPGIELDTLVREHDPPPGRTATAFRENPGLRKRRAAALERLLPKKAFRLFPAGGHAVEQLCDAGALVITEDLRVYHPRDMPYDDPPKEPEENSPEKSLESKDTPKEAIEAPRASA